MGKKQILIIITLITALAIVGTFSFLLGKETTITTLAIANLENQNNQPQSTSPEFRTYTQAFCEEKDFYKECKDHLIVQCGTTKHKINIIDGKANVDLNFTIK